MYNKENPNLDFENQIKKINKVVYNDIISNVEIKKENKYRNIMNGSMMIGEKNIKNNYCKPKDINKNNYFFNKTSFTKPSYTVKNIDSLVSTLNYKNTKIITRNSCIYTNQFLQFKKNKSNRLNNNNTVTMSKMSLLKNNKNEEKCLYPSSGQSNSKKNKINFNKEYYEKNNKTNNKKENQNLTSLSKTLFPIINYQQKFEDINNCDT